MPKQSCIPSKINVENCLLNPHHYGCQHTSLSPFITPVEQASIEPPTPLTSNGYKWNSSGYRRYWWSGFRVSKKPVQVCWSDSNFILRIAWRAYSSCIHSKFRLIFNDFPVGPVIPQQSSVHCRGPTRL